MAFGKKNAGQQKESSVDSGINVFLGAGTTFEGRLEFTGTAQVAGRFTGEIVSAGALVIGQGGEVQGDLDVGQLRVAGTFTGNARCAQKALLQKTAVCSGELKAKTMAMEDGAVFDGELSMGKDPVAKS